MRAGWRMACRNPTGSARAWSRACNSIQFCARYNPCRRTRVISAMAHDHNHSHAHGHAGHHHTPQSFGFAFAVGVTLNSAFVLAELVFGYLANSLALISDALHNFSDVIALLLAWGAAWLSSKRPTELHTYGYRRASILAALVNAALLLLAVGGILVEAVDRIRFPAAVAGTTIIWVAALGIIVNGCTAL